MECQYDTASKETHAQALKRKYQELQSHILAFEEIYETLQTKAELESFEILRRIRAGHNVETVLRFVHEGDILLRLAVVPDPRYSSFPLLISLGSLTVDALLQNSTVS